MATQVKTIFSATCMDAQRVPIEGLVCLVEIAYDDVDLMLRSVRVVCPAASAFSFWYQISRPDRSRTRFGVVNPGTDQTIVISTSAAQRLQLVVGENGKLTGLEGDFAYPAP